MAFGFAFIILAHVILDQEYRGDDDMNDKSGKVEVIIVVIDFCVLVGNLLIFIPNILNNRAHIKNASSKLSGEEIERALQMAAFSSGD